MNSDGLDFQSEEKIRTEKEHEPKNKGKCESEWHVHTPSNDGVTLEPKGHETE